MQKSWVIVSLLNLLLAAFIGVFLRISQLYAFNFPYGNFLHTHSHIAILGWLYLLFFTLIYSKFISKNKNNAHKYSIIFWITQFSILGMMLSFPIQGYAVFSIAFSTLHILASYYFCWITWENLPLSSLSIDILFLKTALVFMFLSTLGVWSLGIIIPTAGKNSMEYSIAIQFFLHFQLNGWFLFGIFSFLFNSIQLKLAISPKKSNLFYTLILSSTILTFVYPLSQYIPSFWFYIINGTGVLLQFCSLIVFFKYIHPLLFKIVNKKDRLIRDLYFFFVMFYFLKIGSQLFLLVPKIAEYSHMIKNLTIGFIHLTVLGIYTVVLFIFIANDTSIFNSKRKIAQIGMYSFIIALSFSEFLLFLQGAFIYLEFEQVPAYFYLISWGSLLFPFSILLLIISMINLRKVF